jgi:predicted regulator of Ras-like GTPase activity (Roadblock/LC7/MglB family)
MADIEVPHPGASDIVGRLLSDALSEHPDVQWLGLVSEDGFAIASEGAGSVDDDAVADGAVRMMIQVRAMSKALGQSGTSQLFLEGAESAICVIDKDPWVLVVVGAPGVPIGLLRYEAREIAEAFPMGQRPALPAMTESEGDDEDEQEAEADWAVVTTGTFLAGEFDEDAADQEIVTEPDGEPEIRWADEPTVPETADTVAGTEMFTSAEAEVLEDLEVPLAGPDDFSDWLSGAPADTSEEQMFDLPPPGSDVPISFEMSAPAEEVAGSLADLAPPAGPAIDLPPPGGQAFELPPPV